MSRRSTPVRTFDLPRPNWSNFDQGGGTLTRGASASARTCNHARTHTYAHTHTLRCESSSCSTAPPQAARPATAGRGWAARSTRRGSCSPPPSCRLAMHTHAHHTHTHTHVRTSHAHTHAHTHTHARTHSHRHGHTRAHKGSPARRPQPAARRRRSWRSTPPRLRAGRRARGRPLRVAWERERGREGERERRL